MVTLVGIPFNKLQKPRLIWFMNKSRNFDFEYYVNNRYWHRNLRYLQIDLLVVLCFFNKVLIMTK